ncbi:MAG TPA: HEAT repeat domain-containing protein [Oligoflexia bacterium]|nr:HEAT repeat domain-containing protein [Oligoflexia bacterium]HMP47904.1 HEAT repeat domain-containing protein [Oligoflexia bacterium]
MNWWTIVTLSFLVQFNMSGCALLLITEPDEQARRVAMNGGVVDSPCSGCKKNLIKSNSNNSFNLNYRQSSRSLLSQEIYDVNTIKVTNLRNQLKSGSDAERTRAASTLGDLGSASIPAVKELEYHCISDKSKWVRRASVKALAKIDGRGSRGVIRKATEDRDPYVKASAQTALNRISR